MPSSNRPPLRPAPAWPAPNREKELPPPVGVEEGNNGGCGTSSKGRGAVSHPEGPSVLSSEEGAEESLAGGCTTLATALPTALPTAWTTSLTVAPKLFGGRRSVAPAGTCTGTLGLVGTADLWLGAGGS
jgi:hypothetical protein